MANMYGKVASYEPSYLLSDPTGANLIAVSAEPGNGTVERGTVLYRKENGMYAPAAAGNATAGNDLVVLDETVDTDAEATIAETVRVYRAGRLISGKVVLAEGAAVTPAIALVLRQQGIVLTAMESADTFDNTLPGEPEAANAT